MTQTNLEDAIIEAALEELREVKQYAIKAAMVNLYVPKQEGDLMESLRVTDLPKKDLGFVMEWGEEQGPNKYVDYADEIASTLGQEYYKEEGPLAQAIKDKFS